MQLLATSIIDKVEGFLHAGYISAYPRPLDPSAYPLLGEEGHSADPVLQLDLVQALQLGEPAAGDAGTDAATGALASFGGGDPHLLLGILAGGGFLAVLYLLCRRLEIPKRKTLTVMASALALLFVFQCSGDNEESLPDDPPWEGVTVREYVHPLEATQAILNGIVAPGLANLGQEAETLPNIQNEVGLPVENLTEGMEYALKTYGLDGWGRELAFEKSAGQEEYGTVYMVTSAGADGEFGSTDDLSKEIRLVTDDDWGFDRNAYFLVKDTDVKVVFHRYKGEMFEYRNASEAQALTGGPLFDLFLGTDFYQEGAVAKINTAYDTMANELDHAPVVMQVF